MSYIEGYLQLDRVRVFHRCWLVKESPVMIIGVHGFVEHGGRYSRVGKAFQECGYGFCIHDLRGHGKTASDEDRGYVDSFDDFIEDLRNYIAKVVEMFKPKKVVLLGHSMGGLIVLHYIARISKYVDAAITSGAAALIPVPMHRWLVLKLLNALTPRKRLELPLNPNYLTHDEEIARRYLEDPLVIKKPTVRLVYELVRASKSIWKFVNRIDKPLLLLHGGEDRIVPPKASTEVYKHVRSSIKELKIYPGLYHEILNETSWKEVFNDILRWLKQYVEKE